MNTVFNSEPQTSEVFQSQPVFMGSGSSAARRPGMTYLPVSL